MNSLDLAQYQTDQLEKELQKRLAEKKKIEEQQQKDILLKNYLERPSCAILGRAYSSSILAEFVLASVTIKGNAGKRYDFKAKVCSSVSTYFSNTFGWSTEREFEEAIKLLVNSYLATRLNDPVVIFELMGLSYTFESGLQSNPIAKRDYEEAVIERMKEFSDEEILSCEHLSHGNQMVDLVKKSRGLIKRRKV